MSERPDFDCIVAGAGAAGLTAALTLAQSGQEVLLLEARETFMDGCNTSMSTAMIPAAGTRWQRLHGVEDSPEQFLADVMQKTGGSADPLVSRALTAVSAGVVDWLADTCEIPLELVLEFRYPGHSTDRCHTVDDRSGRTLHRRLVELARLDARITFGVPLRLSDVTTADEGAVTGAIVTNPDGASEAVSATAVVLATNGFGADPAAVRRHIPEIAGGLYFGGDGSRGDAIAIGSRIDADIGYLDAYQGHGSVAHPHGVLVTWAVIMHGGVIVDIAGRRFGDETVGYSEYAARVLAQPESRAWVLLDERIDRLCRPFADYRDLREAGALRWAPTARELTRRIACGAALEQTLRAAHASAEQGTPDEFGRSFWDGPLEPPFAAVSVTGALFHTQGGLAVDEHARVLRGGLPVKGLYAAGGAAIGISGRGADGYLAGNGLLSAFGLGLLAGEEIARSHACLPGSHACLPAREERVTASSTPGPAESSPNP